MRERDENNRVVRPGWRKRVIFFAIFFILCSAGLSAWFFYYASQPGPAGVDEQVVVFIPKGSGLEEIGRILDREKVINYDIRFLLLARYLGLATSLQAGEFLLESGQRPGDVMRQLAADRPLQHRLTIPEGLRLKEVADILAGDGWVEKQAFLDLARDQEFIKGLGLTDVPSLEGYLFPDTYYLTMDFRDEKNILILMVKRFFEMWSNLEGKEQSSLSRNEVLTMASIIEKETGSAAERARIASVFFNRLKLGMRIQSDPTVIYGIPNFSGRLTRKNLRTKSPFNTYMIPGLPPSPICNPGKKAIQAVLQPEETKDLYFVSKNDGSHYFSKNLAEHNRAVRKYQRKGK